MQLERLSGKFFLLLAVGVRKQQEILFCPPSWTISGTRIHKVHHLSFLLSETKTALPIDAFLKSIYVFSHCLCKSTLTHYTTKTFTEADFTNFESPTRRWPLDTGLLQDNFPKVWFQNIILPGIAASRLPARGSSHTF